jgi:hypothetical protein
MGKLAIQLAPLYSTYYDGVERPYCLNYANSSGELAATRFTYDKKGRNTMGFYQEITGGRSSRNEHAFDADGRIIRKSRAYNDGETSVEEFHYNEEGQLAEEAFKSSNGSEGTARYEYDDEGNAIRMICEGYKGWFTGIIEFELDRRGKRSAGRIIKDGEAAGAITYQYGTGGNLLQEHWDLGGWSQTLQYVYEEAG